MYDFYNFYIVLKTRNAQFTFAENHKKNILVETVIIKKILVETVIIKKILFESVIIKTNPI